MSDNVIKSDDVAPKKSTKTSKPAAKKEKVNSNKSTNAKVPEASEGKKFVYYSSGSGYITRSGFRFTPEKRIYELDIEEADYLLSLDNFRLPDQLELEEYNED